MRGVDCSDEFSVVADKSLDEKPMNRQLVTQKPRLKASRTYRFLSSSRSSRECLMKHGFDDDTATNRHCIALFLMLLQALVFLETPLCK